MVSIAMFSNLFPPVASGSSIQCDGLAAELVRQGHRVCVLTARHRAQEPEVETVAGVEIHRMPALKLPRHAIALNFPWLCSLYRPANIRYATKVLKSRGVEAVHIHNHMFDAAFVALAAARAANLPAVVTIHTVIEHTNKLYDALLSAVDKRFLGPRVIDRAATVVCPDFNVKSYLSRRFGRGDGVIVPYGIGLPDPAPGAAAALRERFGLRGKRVIVSIGHLHALRDRVTLVGALDLLRERHPDAALLIVGAISDDKAQALVKARDLSDRVVFAGPLPHTDVPALYDLAQIVAVWLNQGPPADRSLGVAGMEGMYAGRPVVAVASPDTFGPGVLRAGENLCTVRDDTPTAVAEQIDRLLSDPAFAEKIGAAAREVSRGRFDWAAVARQHVDVYARAIAKGVYGRSA
jgi:1,2-diacylglycerol 3-alpha-glucosyltransferase